MYPKFRNNVESFFLACLFATHARTLLHTHFPVLGALWFELPTGPILGSQPFSQKMSMIVFFLFLFCCLLFFVFPFLCPGSTPKVGFRF